MENSQLPVGHFPLRKHVKCTRCSICINDTCWNYYYFYIYNKLSKLHVQNTIVFHNYDKIHKDSGYRTFINWLKKQKYCRFTVFVLSFFRSRVTKILLIFGRNGTLSSCMDWSDLIDFLQLYARVYANSKRKKIVNGYFTGEQDQTLSVFNFLIIYNSKCFFFFSHIKASICEGFLHGLDVRIKPNSVFDQTSVTASIWKDRNGSEESQKQIAITYSVQWWYQMLIPWYLYNRVLKDSYIQKHRVLP